MNNTPPLAAHHAVWICLAAGSAQVLRWIQYKEKPPFHAAWLVSIARTHYQITEQKALPPSSDTLRRYADLYQSEPNPNIGAEIERIAGFRRATVSYALRRARINRRTWTRRIPKETQ